MLNLQVEGCGGLGTFNAEGLTFSSNMALLGCMDEEACNYNSLANTDDGSCCYDHCFQAQASGEVEIESGMDGSVVVLVPTEGQVQACLPWGCYVVRGASEVSWNGLDAQGESYGDGQLFEVGHNQVAALVVKHCQWRVVASKGLRTTQTFGGAQRGRG